MPEPKNGFDLAGSDLKQQRAWVISVGGFAGEGIAGLALPVAVAAPVAGVALATGLTALAVLVAPGRGTLTRRRLFAVLHLVAVLQRRHGEVGAPRAAPPQ